MPPVRDQSGRVSALKVRRNDDGESKAFAKYTYLSSAKHGGCGAVQSVHWPQSKFVTDPTAARITEGEPKADFATIITGVRTIAIPGVSSWKLAVDAIDSVQGQRVLIAYDADWRTNQLVAKSLHSLIFELRPIAAQRGTEILVETWNPAHGKGIDDLLLSGKKPDAIPVDSPQGDELLAQIEMIANGRRVRSAAVPKIIDGVDEDRVNEEAEKALGRHPNIYAGGGELVHVVHPPGEPARIVPLQAGLLQEYMAATADWVSIVSTPEGLQEQSIHPPARAVKATQQRGNFAHVRPLIGVVSFPILRPGGTIAAAYGYDAATRLFNASNVTVDVPEEPTQADAAAAMATLLDVVCDVPFADDSHRAAFIAALLTPIARPMIDGLTPGFLVEANARGTGKGLLANVIGSILAGQDMEATPYAEDEEVRKKLTASVRQGRRILLFDNIVGKFGGGSLDAFLTARFWEDRILGLSQTGCWPNNTVIYATANNTNVAEDTCRRLCLIRLETPHEKPEDRSDFKRPRLLEYVRDERPRLLSAAFTILRAYIAAGRPDVPLKPWGSFEAWSTIVRGAIVFAGGADPGETKAELQSKAGSATEAAGIFAAALADMCDDGKSSLTCKEIVEKLRTPEMRFNGIEGKDVIAALETCMAEVGGRSLGNWLRQFDRRQVGGYVIRRSNNRARTGGFRWTADGPAKKDATNATSNEEAPVDVASTATVASFSAHTTQARNKTSPPEYGEKQNSPNYEWAGKHATEGADTTRTGGGPSETVPTADALKRLLVASPVPLSADDLARQSGFAIDVVDDLLVFLVRSQAVKGLRNGVGDVYAVPAVHGDDPSKWHTQSAPKPNADGAQTVWEFA